MKKALLIAAAVLVIGLAVWLIWFRKRKPGETVAATLPPAVVPPAGGATGLPGNLFDPNSGPGKVVIDQRTSELVGAGYSTEIAASLNADVALFVGVTAADIFRTNAKASAGVASCSQLPFALNPMQKAAMLALQNVTYTGSMQTWGNIGTITTALTNLQNNFGFTLIGGEAMQGGDPFVKKYLCGTYFNCPNGKKPDEYNFQQGIKASMADVNRFSRNYITFTENVAAKVRERAIQDLRGSGWKFVGYDQPT